jgi:nicotinamidase-related amidase
MNGAETMLKESGAAFGEYLDRWLGGLSFVPLESVIAEAGGAAHVGIFCVDVINGFCHEGQLASPRVRGIIAPISSLMSRAYLDGVRQFIFTHDAHDPDAAEFDSYPPHCLRDSSESAIVAELMSLPFANEFTILPKNTISSAIGTGLDAWLAAHPEITHRIVVGDCTDLCTYQLAMHLKLSANAVNERLPVIVPADCVNTYEIPFDVAASANILAHPADILHATFLHNMAANGVRVVRTLT